LSILLKRTDMKYLTHCKERNEKSTQKFQERGISCGAFCLPTTGGNGAGGTSSSGGEGSGIRTLHCGIGSGGSFTGTGFHGGGSC
jgi:hypothetical protein